MTADANSAQVHLAPLTRMEALYLLAGVRVGLVVCADQGMTVERPGFHTVTGTAEPVTDVYERRHYLRTLPGFTASHGNQLLRIRPQLITGHRFQNLTARATP